MRIPFFVFFASTIITIILAFRTTLDGPFKPETAPLDSTLNPVAFDLLESDPSFAKPISDFPLPEQISISLSYTFDSIWISWVTGDFQEDSVQSIVEYSEYDVVSITNKTKGYSILYNNYTTIHHVQLKDLKPNTLYRYRCGDPSLSAMSKEYYFRTMPDCTLKNYPRRIVVGGDLGLTYNASTTLTHILSNHPDLVVLIGGFSYTDSNHERRWDYWGRFMETLAANVPTMIVAGKHEVEAQTDNNAYSSRFTFPSNESASFSPLYYSFNAGGVHFVVLNSYIAYDNSSVQYAWLESDLSCVNRTETPWLIVTWSRPWYSTFKGHYREAESMRIELEDLLYSYRVDIIFNSEVDAYERSNRVYNYTLDECGPVYIATGAGGGGKLETEHVDDPGNCPDSVEDEFCPVKQPEYSAYRESSFGFGMLEVKNETHALWSWNRNQDLYYIAGDIIYIVRQPEICSVIS